MLAVLADALLGEEDGTGRTDVNGRCHEQQQHTAEQAAHQAAGDVHGTLQKGLLGGGIVHAAGQHGIIADLFHDLYSAWHMGNLLQIQMHRDTHFHKVIHQLMGQSLVFRQIDKDLIHPVFLGIGRCTGKICHYGNAADFQVIPGGIRQHQTGDPVHAVIVFPEIVDDLLRTRPGTDQQQGTVSHPAGFLQHPFPENAGTVADGHIQNRHQEHADSGIVSAHLLGKQIKDRKQLHKDRLLNQSLHFPVVAPLQHIPERLREKNHQQIAQHQENAHICIQRLCIRVFPVMVQRIGKHERKLQHQQVQDHKIKMLQPAFCISSVH